MEADIRKILQRFGINNPSTITQVHRSAWDIDGAYILKQNSDRAPLDKSTALCRLLLSEGIPTIDYINTTEGDAFFYQEGYYWCLMKKIKGTCFDPFVGDAKQNGILLGEAVAKLHMALERIEDKIEVADVNFAHELSSWILPILYENNAVTRVDLTKDLTNFLNTNYQTLPRQLIHRDLHTGNMIYDNGEFFFIDFDMCQRNVRIFDIAYLGCSELLENYKDTSLLKRWRKIFGGILKGYIGLMPLSGAEINALPYLFIYDALFFAAYYYNTAQPKNAQPWADLAGWIYDNMRAITGNLQTKI